jgi:hypothetical protein
LIAALIRSLRSSAISSFDRVHRGGAIEQRVQLVDNLLGGS